MEQNEHSCWHALWSITAPGVRLASAQGGRGDQLVGIVIVPPEELSPLGGSMQRTSAPVAVSILVAIYSKSGCDGYQDKGKE